MPDESHETNRITVSRDALRAELAEMELRLRVYFDEQLRHKAETSVVLRLAHQIDLKAEQVDLDAVATKVDKLDRGEFTDVHERAISARIEAVLNARYDSVWTLRQRLGTTLTVCTALGTFVLYIVIAVKGGRL